MSSIGRTFWTLLALVVCFGVASAQVTTIFIESMGTVSTTTTIATHETNDGFDNDSYTMSGTADVRSTTASSGYSGASGSANVFFGTSGGNAKEFTIAGINSSNYTSLTLSFGVLSTTSSSAITIEVSSDGSNWTALSYTAPANTSWNLVSASGSIPSTSTLYIRFSKNSTVSWRIDDVKLTGIINEPTTSASSITFPVVNVNDMQISWTNGDGAERVVLVKASSAVDSDPVDGTAYTADPAFGSGDQVGTGNYVVYAGSGNSVTVTGLSASTTYHVAVYEYNGSGTGVNYRTTSPATASQATDAPSGSSASDIVQIVPETEASDIAHTSYQAASITTTSDGIRVWSIQIRDGGGSADGDALGTILTDITIGKGASNTVTSWANTLRRAALFDGSTQVAEGAVTGETITFSGMSGANVTAADNGSKTLDLYVTFESAVTDNERLQFEVTSATADAAGSLFAETNAGGAASTATGDVNRLEVTATDLIFSVEPSKYVLVSNNFSLHVKAVDLYSNLDLDATTSVTLATGSGSGTLSSATGLTQSLVAGEYSWTDVQTNVVEATYWVVTTNTGILGNATTEAFEVYGGVFLENFAYTTSDPLTSHGWTAHSGAGSNAITVSATNLTYSGYTATGGGAATLTASGEDIHKTFTQVTSGTVYASFLVNITSKNTTGDYFLHLSTNPQGSFYCRVAVNDIGGSLAFGIAKASTITYTSADYSYNTTYLMVIRYTFNAGAGDDEVALFINPTVPGAEPGSPTVSGTSTEADIAGIGSIGIRQGTNSPAGLVDGIRISTSWESVPLPVQLSSFTVAAGLRGAELKWRTESEVDNAGFEVERREIGDLRLSSGDYLKIGFVAGAGTSTSAREYSYTDAPAPGRYAYRLKQIDRDGSASYFGEVEVEVGAVAKQFQLGEAFPNPFNPSTAIEFSLAEQGVASLKIYNVLGQEVATLFNASAEAGRLYRATWDASGVPSGMYFARLESGNASAMKRMMLVK